MTKKMKSIDHKGNDWIKGGLEDRPGSVETLREHWGAPRPHAAGNANSLFFEVFYCNWSQWQELGLVRNQKNDTGRNMLAVVRNRGSARGTRMLCEDLVKRDFLSDDRLAAVGIKTWCLDLVRRKCTVV